MEKVFVGQAKAVTFDWGSVLKISFNKADLDKMYSMLNAKGYVNLDCKKRKEVSQYGQTHSITVDTWQPQGQAQAPQQPPQVAQQGGNTVAQEQAVTDVPF